MDADGVFTWRAAMGRVEACLRGHRAHVLEGTQEASFGVRQMTKIIGRVEDESWGLFRDATGLDAAQGHWDEVFLPDLEHVPSVVPYNLLLDVYAHAASDDVKYAEAALVLLIRLEEAAARRKDPALSGQPIATEDGTETRKDAAVAGPLSTPMWAPDRRSYNSVIQAALNAPNGETGVRIAFEAFERLGKNELGRNSRTFGLIIGVAGRHLSDATARGEIVRAMFSGACKEGVVDEGIMEAIRGVGVEGADERFAKWMLEDDGGMKNKTVRDIKPKFSRNSKRLSI